MGSVQARRQNSVAEGGGGTGKVFSQFGSEDRKYVLHPKLRPVDTGSLPPFWVQFSFGGARSLPGVAPRILMVQIGDGADNKKCIRMLRCVRKPCPHAAPQRQ